jgi:hypothetical protein
MPRSRTWYGRRKSAEDVAREIPALTAAAATVDANRPPTGTQMYWGGAGWQNEGWDHYDSTPELHRAASDMGEAFSRAVMMVVDVDPVSGELGEDPTDDQMAGAIGTAMFGGRPGQAQAQRAIGEHMTVPGECWILATDPALNIDDEPWQVLSVNEVAPLGGTGIQITRIDGSKRMLVDGELLFRVWQPHPKRRVEANSPVRAALPVLRELAGLSAQVMAAIRSRLASAGVWLLPDSATLPAPLDELGREIPGTPSDHWLRLLGNAMMTAVANPDDPSALVPIVAMVPDGVLEKIKDPFQFVRDVISDIQPIREAAIKRLAVGFDAPPERLLGLASVNHWGQWFMDESFVKGPLSAYLAVPADAFTKKYLRPALQLAGKNPDAFAIAYDVRGMLPDVEATNAQQAWDAGKLAGRKYLEAMGFDPDVRLTVPVTTKGPTAAPPLDPATPATAPAVAQPSTTDTQQAPQAMPTAPAPNGAPVP